MAGHPGSAILYTLFHSTLMYSRLLLIAAIFMSASGLMATAQTVSETRADSVPTIVDIINSNTGRTVTIDQPDALNGRLRADDNQSATDEQSDKTEAADDNKSVKSSGQHKVSGFRVQVYSDSKAQSARNNAYNKKRQIESALPGHRCYVIYNAPYWRVKVGDFKSRADADALAEDIRRRFPAMSRDIRVVRDRVNAK